jgi:hypothetical protein
MSSVNIIKGNNSLEKIANDNKSLYVDNDCQFRLLNGAVNIHLYARDGDHVNAKGVSKLVGNLSIMSRKKSQDNVTYKSQIRKTTTYSSKQRKAKLRPLQNNNCNDHKIYYLNPF